MAIDTITLKLKIESDFKTIQAIRQQLSSPQVQSQLGQAVVQQITMMLANELGQFELTPSVKISRYSETKKGSKLPSPKVKNDILTLWDRELDRKIESFPLTGPDWFDWLENPATKSFRYESPQGVFTAIKERRSGHFVWYAHRRITGELKRIYLGKSENLTPKKLLETARKLNPKSQLVSLSRETSD
jgi:hypothetical protein